MNYLKKTIPLIAVLLLCTFAATAQDIDANRMNRDINIMENILQEIFKTQFSKRGDNVRIHSDRAFAFGHGQDIKGTYLPGYGVIFNVPANKSSFFVFQQQEANRFSYNFEYGEEEDKKVTEESITNRIVEFLQDYGSTLGQLSDDDRVMVIYNSEAPDHRVAFFSSSDEDSVERKTIPTISVVATKATLQAYRSGDINAEEFRNRLDISTSEDGSKQMDLKVMARVLETAFEDTDQKSFRVVGSVDYLKLDNFGALFSFDARYAEHGWGDFHRSIEIIQGKLAETRIELREKLEAEEEKEFSEKHKKMEQRQQEQKENALNAYKKFTNDLKEYIADYGRTLNSLDSDQRILVSVTLNNRYDEVPERIELQIPMSVLESVDRGRTSREEAINQISIREY